MKTADVQEFFHKQTNTFSYVVSDPETRHAIVIDPVLDYDHKSGRTGTGSAATLADFIREKGFSVEWVLETHAHADHLTAAPYLKEKLGGLTGIGAGIAKVQGIFKNVFNCEESFAVDGSQFDRLFIHGDVVHAGGLVLGIMHTPGHTPACVTYTVDDAAFVGDTLFMPDFGTARTDFPGGSAETLFQSIRRVLSLPEKTRLFMCHDYKAPGRDEYKWESTVAEELADNIHVGGDVSQQEFVKMRNLRDKTLDMPKLLLPSVQVNIRAGHLPPQESNGVSYLKIPVDAI